MAAYVGCVGGAILVDEYAGIVKEAGLRDVRITSKDYISCINPDTKDPVGRAITDCLGEDESLAEYVASIYLEGYK